MKAVLCTTGLALAAFGGPGSADLPPLTMQAITARAVAGIVIQGGIVPVWIPESSTPANAGAGGGAGELPAGQREPAAASCTEAHTPLPARHPSMPYDAQHGDEPHGHE